MNTDSHHGISDNTIGSPQSQALKARYEKAMTAFYKLPERDRLALTILSAFVGLLILVYGAILPAMNYHQQAREHFKDEQALLYWLKAQEPAIQRISAAPRASQTFSGNPLSLVNASTKDFNLSIKRLQPENSGSLRVWMENVNFDNTLQWLHYLQSKGLSLREISIDQQAKGKVNVRATFMG